MKIEDVNKLTLDIFINNFKNIFEKTCSIANLCENKRPFINKDHLIQTFLCEFDNLKLEDKKNVIKNHPDLGDKFKINSNLTQMSKNEQKSVGLDNCNEEEYLLFNKMNNEFKLKFDIPFIYAVKGANKFMIIEEFKRRLKNNNVENELSESIKQVKKIAFLRLDEIIDE
tara:strand:+ start:3012 stop:3521 length:510 start_codon:yes stop_codon:yes gene_type:complete